MQSPLIHTERRLVTLFVGGAFLFLLIFEALFLGGRVILENQFQKNEFEKVANRLIERMHSNDPRMKGGKGIPLDINFIVLDQAGNIVDNRIGSNSKFEAFAEVFTFDFINSLPDKKVTSFSGYFIQKVAHPYSPGHQTIIFKSEGYEFDDLVRDIIRFLALDIVILIPFWYMARFLVREILKPVGDNIEVMGHFVHDAGHELKTPLSVVSGNLQILRDQKTKDHTLIQESIDQIQAMGDSIDGLVELSNLRLPTKIEKLSLLDAVEEQIKIQHTSIEQKQLSLHIDIPKTSRIQMTGKHFSILFSNILKNAITYNTLGGTIEVSFSGKTLSIRDSGIGMTQVQQKSIFDRFYRVDRSGKYPGSGIGLALVDRIVRLYGWTVSVESVPGRGTTFVFQVK